MSNSVQVCSLILLQVIVAVCGELCGTSHSCRDPYKCCGNTCCLPNHLDHHHYHGFGFRWSIWNMWYFWFIVIFILMSCFGGCGYWRRRQLLAQQQHMMSQYETYQSSGSCNTYTGPQLTLPMFPASYDTSRFMGTGVRCAQGEYRQEPPPAFFPSPPPYSEVMSKPDVWPPNKDELPPYPGEPVIMADQAQALADNIAGTEAGDTGVPGLPPYSLNDSSNMSGYAMPQPTVATLQNTTMPSGGDSQPTQDPVQATPTDSHLSSQVTSRNGQDVPSSVPDVQT